MPGAKAYKGAAVPTTIATGISSSDMSVTVAGIVGYPTGADFVLILNEDGANEEKILCSGASGATFTIVDRGYDDTTAQSHISGEPVSHGWDADSAQDANNHIYNVSRNDHTQYLLKTALFNLVWPITSVYTGYNATNPSDPSLLGAGTWLQFAEGQVLVGQKPADSNFGTLGNTGGEVTHVLTAGESGIRSHTHTYSGTTSGQSADHAHTEPGGGSFWVDEGGGTNNAQGGSDFGQFQLTGTTGGTTADHNHVYSGTTSDASGTGASGSAHNNLQPYVVVYYFRRTA